MFPENTINLLMVASGFSYYLQKIHPTLVPFQNTGRLACIDLILSSNVLMVLRIYLDFKEWDTGILVRGNERKPCSLCRAEKPTAVSITLALVKDSW